MLVEPAQVGMQLLGGVGGCGGRCDDGDAARGGPRHDGAQNLGGEFHALLDRHAIEFHHAIAGKMQLYYEPSALAAASRISILKCQQGAVQEVLTAREAIALEPALSDAKGLFGVIYTPGDAVGDAERFCHGLTEVLAAQYGVTTAFGVTIRAVVATGDGVRLTLADGDDLVGRALVITLGPQTNSVLRSLDVRVPILPMKGYSITAAPGKNAPHVSITDTAHKIVFARLGSRIRVAGGAEIGNNDPTVIPAGVKRLLHKAQASLPAALDDATLEPGWAGLRPMTPDGFPIIGPSLPNIFLNVGHGMLGWTLAMGSAERLAGMVVSATSGSGDFNKRTFG